MSIRKWTSAVVGFVAAVVVLLPSKAAHAQINFVDVNPPTCKLLAISNTPPRSIILEVQDVESGLASILFAAVNATVTTFPSPIPFGYRGPVLLVVTQTDPTRRQFTVIFRIQDVAGNIRLCDPVVTELSIPHGHGWVTQTQSGIGPTEGVITIQNGSPGMSSFKLAVNGKWSWPYRMHAGQVLRIDVTRMLHDGDNTISIAGSGADGGNATVMIADN